MNKKHLKYIIFILIFGIFFAGCYAFNNSQTAKEVPNFSQTVYADELPTSYCIRDEYFLPTENQHSQGLCWAFASTYTFSTAVMKSTNQYINYSEGWVSAKYADINTNYTPGAGATIYNFNGVNEFRGIVQEQDFNYEDSYQISQENASDLVDYYSQFADGVIVKNYKHTRFGISRGDDKLEQRELIKQHIYNQSGLYLSCNLALSSQTVDGKTIYFQDPTNTTSTASHALTVIGWDDDVEVILNGTTYQGAWITLNEYGNSDSRSDGGILYYFYDDPNYTELVGYTYQEVLDSLYFYNTLTSSSSSYELNLAKVCQNSLQNNLKTKNVFLPTDDIELVYSYKISSNTDIDNICIYNLQTDVTKKFDIVVNSQTNTISIASNQELNLGSYKIIFGYKNTTQSEQVCGAFYIVDGTETEYIAMSINPNSLANTNLKAQGINIAGTTYNSDIFFSSQKIDGTVNLTVYMSTYSSVKQLVLTNMNAEEGAEGREVSTGLTEPQKSHTLQFTYDYWKDSANSVGHYQLSIICETATRVVNIYIYYFSETTTKFVTRINYGLNGGVNNELNRNVMVTLSNSPKLIKKPTKEGYSFEGWYYSKDFDNSSKLKYMGGEYYLEFNKIIHYTQNHVYWDSNTTNTMAFYSHVIYAKFVRYEITVSCQGGEISESGIVYVEKNSNKTFTISCQDDYCLNSVYIDGQISDAGLYEDYLQNGITFNNIASNHTLLVVFVPKSTVRFSITITEDSNGRITCEESLTDVGYGETRVFTVTPNEGYRVKDLKVNNKLVELNNNQLSLIVKQNLVIVATYEQIPSFVVIIMSSQNGKITCNQDLTAVYSGDTRTFTVTPDEGYIAKQVKVNNVPVQIINNQFSIVVESGVIISSTFAIPQEFIVTISELENGRITCDQDLTNVLEDSVLTFTVTPNVGYIIKQVKVNDGQVEIEDNQFSIVVSEDIIIDATFEIISNLAVTILEIENGQIVCNQGLENIEYGQTRTFVVTANQGYRVQEVKVNNQPVEIQNSQFTITVVNNTNISATFEQIFTVTILESQNGAISCEENLTGITSGQIRTFIVTADEGYKVKEVKVNDEEVEIEENRFTITVTQDVRITAEFEEVVEEKPSSNIVLPIIITAGVVSLLGLGVAVIVKIKKSREF